MKGQEKFTSYKTVFAIFLILIFLSSVYGALKYTKNNTFAYVIDDINYSLDTLNSKFIVSFSLEAVFLTLVFIAGPTIYAPTTAFLAIILYGLLSGARICATANDNILPITIEVFFSCITAYLLVIYSSFVTLTCLKIFSGKKSDDTKELFGGVLFYSKRFCGIFNLKYLASYIAFFTLILISNTLLTTAKNFLLSLF